MKTSPFFLSISPPITFFCLWQQKCALTVKKKKNVLFKNILTSYYFENLLVLMAPDLKYYSFIFVSKSHDFISKRHLRGLNKEHYLKLWNVKMLFYFLKNILTNYFEKKKVLIVFEVLVVLFYMKIRRKKKSNTKTLGRLPSRKQNNTLKHLLCSNCI